MKNLLFENRKPHVVIESLFDGVSIGRVHLYVNKKSAARYGNMI
jgi:hypothetical protein